MDELIRYHVLENGVIEFINLSNQRAAVDEFFKALSKAMEGHPKEITFRYLVDTSQSDIPPFGYFLEKNRLWVRENSDIAPTRAAVLLSRNNPFRSFAFSLANVLMRGAKSELKVQIFDVHERDKALSWLLANGT
jgi:hypothetical protein